ncbi:hypothetical protein BJL95_20190 [Methylomonas sp. LWB]|uniref:hypothetical protein n=1 Tax=Methylomonas sp. LWB TaxID=1905845 RepID=UPI0008DA23F2|nr:hypothetical protein [Methylomonas sp. LWB]OHX37012.1 hypothetical protein BJL95_20190 [Methylomonas sp. LWB]
MFKKAYQFLMATILVSLKKNAASVLFWLGIVLILTGSLFGDIIDSWHYAPKGTGEAILKIGAAVLGAGVFAVIMKSAQFTDLFQQHVFDVFYRPENLPHEKITDRWELLADSLLKEVLFSNHYQAAITIKNQFFSNELQYHFEDLSITYDIEVVDNTASCTNSLTAKLALSPCHENPIFTQALEVGGSCDLVSLFINDEMQDVSQLLSADSLNPKLRKIDIELKNFAKSLNQTDSRTVKLERVLKFTQSLDEEPYIVATISRYISGGAVIKAQISPGYRMYFKKTGFGVSPPNVYSNDGHGYTRWQLARANDLLLPGQGYMIMIIPSKNISGTNQS